MNITLGTHKTTNALLKELKDKGFKVSDYAQEILQKIPLSKQKTEIELEIVKVKDLGFTGFPSLRDIYAQAKEKGYALCPPEVGPQLRLQGKNLPYWVYVAMDPIVDSDRYPRILLVDEDGSGLWLDTDWSRLDSEFDPEFEFVFSKVVSGPLASETKTLDPLSFDPSEKSLMRIAEALERIADHK